MSTTSESGIASNLGNFQTMTGFCQSFGIKYKPSNPLISLDALNGCHQLATESVDAVKAANKAVIDNSAPLVAARSHRNYIFNDPDIGLVAIANLVKKYIKSVYKPNSIEFKKVSALNFRKIS